MEQRKEKDETRRVKERRRARQANEEGVAEVEGHVAWWYRRISTWGMGMR